MRIALPLLATVAACGGPVVLEDVSYDLRHGAATTMDVYLPDDGGTGRPAVMFVHGGGWRSFSKEAHAEAAERMARSGWVAATINYRLVPDGVFPAAPQDCLCALAFLRAHAGDYGLDPDRIAAVGYSAGGHLVSLLGVAAADPAVAPECDAGGTYAPAAVVSGAGPEDLRPLAKYDAIRDFVGGTLDDVPEAYDAASPITHVGPGSPPFLFVHAEGDLFVDLDTQTRPMHEALLAAGGESHLLSLAGGGHLLNPGPGVGPAWVETSLETPEAWLATVDFLTATLGAP